MVEWYFLWMLVGSIACLGLADKIEVIEETGCPDSEFRLTCARLSSLIAILSAGLYPEEDVEGHVDNLQEFGNNSRPLPQDVACPRRYSAKLQRDVTDWLNIEREFNGKGFQNLRGPLNNRCSGKNHCSFKLYEDHRNSEQWGPGQIRITYACMTESSISRLCSANLSRPSGFIMSPGYPGFYVGGVSCSWTITPPPGLHVQISLLDVSLREVAQDEPFCMDTLTIIDHSIDRHLFNTCGEAQTMSIVKSHGHQKLTVTLTTQSKRMYPKRGFLIYYKVLGCQLPSLPKNVRIISLSPASRLHQSKAKHHIAALATRQKVNSGPEITERHHSFVYKSVQGRPAYATYVRQKKTYAVQPNGNGYHRKAIYYTNTNTDVGRGWRDGSSLKWEQKLKHLTPLASSLASRVVYACTKRGYVFPDSLLQERDLVCVDGRNWNNTLPDCINMTENNYVENNFEEVDNARAVMANESADMVYDIVVPCLLIAGLLLGNAVVLFFIHRYKKRRPKEHQPEELVTIASSSMPSTS